MRNSNPIDQLLVLAGDKTERGFTVFCNLLLIHELNAVHSRGQSQNLILARFSVGYTHGPTRAGKPGDILPCNVPHSYHCA